MAKYQGFIGSSDRVRSINVGCEQTVNWYIENAGGTPKATPWLVPTPGLAPFCVLSNGPVRALFAMDGRAFAVGGTGFYELFANHTATLRGAVNQNAFPATISSNGSNGGQLLVTSAGVNWIYDLTDNTFVLLGPTTPTVPTRMSTFSDGYFVALKANSNEFQISALYDGTTWDALDVFQVSTVADQVVALIESHRDLWLFGSQTTSVWSNVGDADNPYQPVPGVKIEQGCGAAFSAIAFDNAIMWLGSGTAGDRIVWRANGYTPERVSTHAVEFALGQARRIDDAIAWTYQQEGHTFYCLYVPDLANVRGFSTTWVYDVATNAWHERALWDSERLDWQPHPGRCHVFAFGRHLVGDRSSGAIYDMRLGLADDTTVVVASAGPAPDPVDPPATPTLTSVSPNNGERGGTIGLTLVGTGFVVGATTPAVSGTGVTVQNVVVASTTILTADLVLDVGATANARSVTVTTAGGTSNARTFTITAAVEPGERTLLTQAAFAYKGMMSVGADTSFGGNLQRKGYARGNLAGRRVDGELRLFITGSHADEWRSPVYEMTVPDEATWVTSYSDTPPTLSIVKDWAEGVRGADAPLYPNGQPVYDVNGRTVKGLFYDPDMNGLWYSYLATYNTGPVHDPSIGFIALDDDTGDATGYGPWRHRVRSPYTGGYGFHVPSDWRAYFGDCALVFGAETATRGALGFSLCPTERPASPTTLPTDTEGNYYDVVDGPGSAQPRWSLDGAPAIAHGSGTDGYDGTQIKCYQRDANFVNCGWTDTEGLRQSPADVSNPAYISDPDGNGGVAGKCNMDAIDSIGASVFIDTGTAYGVVCFGVLVWPSDDYATPHGWYGPAGNVIGDTDNTGCAHGQIAPTGNSGTGYYASGLSPFWWIFDPADLKDGYDGTTPVDEVEPAAAFSAREMHGSDATVLARMNAPTRWYITGAYYDDVDGYLYVAEDAGATGGEPRTMIHVFQVTA
jgi:hypothetical protein